MNKLIEQIDKVINKKGSLKTPAYYIRGLLIDIVNYIDKKINSLNNDISTINKKVTNLSNNVEYNELNGSEVYNINFEKNKELVYFLTGSNINVRKSHFNVVGTNMDFNGIIKLFFYINTNSSNRIVLHEVKVTCDYKTVTINEDGSYIVNIYRYGIYTFVEVNKTNYIHP